MVTDGRTLTLEQAASGRPAPARRRARQERAQVLASGPPWLHEGTTLRLTVRAATVDLFGISVLAAGVDRPTPARSVAGSPRE